VTGYAYESVPNKPIITGKQEGPTKKSRTKQANIDQHLAIRPASLGSLARGALGLDVWRKRDSISIAEPLRPVEKRS
jgi:hypothetical protein